MLEGVTLMPSLDAVLISALALGIIALFAWLCSESVGVKEDEKLSRELAAYYLSQMEN